MAVVIDKQLPHPQLNFTKLVLLALVLLLDGSGVISIRMIRVYWSAL
ncbi:hypothetical protein AB7078_07800 [Proteus mirabilis]|nr:hypothetical protein [Proteus mirabilis]